LAEGLYEFAIRAKTGVNNRAFVAADGTVIHDTQASAKRFAAISGAADLLKSDLERIRDPKTNTFRLNLGALYDANYLATSLAFSVPPGPDSVCVGLDLPFAQVLRTAFQQDLLQNPEVVRLAGPTFHRPLPEGKGGGD
jgi:hypothetical protein